MHWAGKDRFLTAYNDWSLQKFGVLCHDFDELIIGEILVGDEGLVCRFFCAYRISRQESRAAQEAFQFLRCERMLQIIHAFKVGALFGQDPLDLAAGASGGLLVQDCFWAVGHGFQKITAS